MNYFGSSLRPSADWSNGLLPFQEITKAHLPFHHFDRIFGRHLGLMGPSDYGLYPTPPLLSLFTGVLHVLFHMGCWFASYIVPSPLVFLGVVSGPVDCWLILAG